MNTKEAAAFNARQIEAGRITPEVVAKLTALAQLELGFTGDAVDGKCGPGTLAALAKLFASIPPAAPSLALTIDENGWLVGENVMIVKMHPSWFGGPLIGDAPGGVVCHVSATNHGTALNMANRRARKFKLDPDDRLSSWHATVAFDGKIVQMIPFTHRAHHAGSETAKKVIGLGWPNSRALGIELEGWERGPFPPAQVAAYERLLRAIVRHYNIEERFAMITHASIDPGRRSDPGPVWMRDHAPGILQRIYHP